MKAVFVGINSSFSHSSLSVYTLLENTKFNGLNSSVLEFNINQNVKNIISRLEMEKADVYLFSCYVWNIEIILKVATSLKKISKGLIVLGGSEVSYSPKGILEKNPFIDYIILGEGEEVTQEFLYSLKENKEIKIDNVVEKGSKSFDIKRKDLDFDSLRFPYKNVDLSQFENRIIYYESSRGCPFSCSYCMSHLDKKVRYRSIEKVKEEILFFINNNIPLVKFVDRTFNANKERTKEIFSFIIENSKSTSFHFEICPELLDDEIISILSKAKGGLFQLEMGIQSLNDKTLKEINRFSEKEKLLKFIPRLAENNNIHIHTDLIAGLPFESLESFKESFSFAYNLKGHMLQLGFLKVLDGTKMKEKAKEYLLKYEDNPPYEILENKWINFNELNLLDEIEDLVDKVHNSLLFQNTLDYFINNYFNSPFTFFEKLNEFINENHYIKPIGKEEFYKILLLFLKEKNEKYAYNLLLFDYLKYFKKSPPPFLLEGIKIKQMSKEEAFEFIKEEKNNKYFASFDKLPSKEIFKKVTFMSFDINPFNYKEEETSLIFYYDKNKNDLKGYEGVILD